MEIDSDFFCINIRIYKYRNVLYKILATFVASIFCIYVEKKKKYSIYSIYSKNEDTQESIEILYIS